METHYIHPKALKTALSADMAMKKAGWTFPWGRSAALSSETPDRNLIGQWKNKACHEVEAKVAAGGLQCSP